MILVGMFAAVMMVVQLVSRRVVAEAQERVRHDLNSARMVYDQRLESIVTVVELTAQRFFIRTALREGEPQKQTREELGRVRQQYGLDFLSVTDCKGVVVIRTREPYLTGDDRSKDSLIRHALEGQVVGSTEIVSREQLALEGALLDARAYLKLVPTPRAKPLEKTEETSGMVMEAAVPFRDEQGMILGVVYGGVLLNRNYEIVDGISEMVYGDGQYHGKRVGSATVFQRDERISTTILSKSGQRAIGTRVSSAVHDAVLQKGDRWVDRAFVVDDWYIAAYEPVRNTDGEIVGMLYVGLLERPYVDMKRNLMLAVLGFAAVGMAVALGLATVLGKAITRPVTELVRGTQRIAAGDLSCRIARPTTDEIGRLADAFNTMAQSLQETIGEKDRLNAELRRSEQTLK
ncbi:MAG TPA: cache domain-containing protein, partial [Phycisphaerae bacterium]|nr:cache domain-containing protein [Phycisphaerae bacterium]